MEKRIGRKPKGEEKEIGRAGVGREFLRGGKEDTGNPDLLLSREKKTQKKKVGEKREGKA